MSDTTRVRAWRQRRKDAGLIAVTLWLQPETKARYEDLALTHRRSLSELAQLALDAYRLDPAAAAASVTDTEQLRALIREELDEAMAIITATVSAIVTDTAKEALPALVETALQRYITDTVPDTETATPQEPSWLTTVEAFVSDMATATDTDTGESALPQEPPAPSVSDTDTAIVPETTAPTAAAPEAATARTPLGQHKLTPRQAAALRAKRQRGAPIKALMEEYGLSKATVHRYLRAPRRVPAAAPGAGTAPAPARTLPAPPRRPRHAT
jgi:hypothetical protein